MTSVGSGIVGRILPAQNGCRRGDLNPHPPKGTRPSTSVSYTHLESVSIGEHALRLNYMASICWSSVSLLLLLAYPFRGDLVSPLLGLIAMPYFLAMASDLRFCGYKRLDVLRIYGFNLVLLPVNVCGVANSIVQALTGDKSVFGRTPKVSDRTIPNFLFVLTRCV